MGIQPRAGLALLGLALLVATAVAVAPSSAPSGLVVGGDTNAAKDVVTTTLFFTRVSSDDVAGITGYRLYVGTSGSGFGNAVGEHTLSYFGKDDADQVITPFSVSDLDVAAATHFLVAAYNADGDGPTAEAELVDAQSSVAHELDFATGAVVDVASSTLSIQVAGSPTISSSGMTLDGSTNFLQLAALDTLLDSSHHVTIECWMRWSHPSTTTTYGVFSLFTSLDKQLSLWVDAQGSNFDAGLKLEWEDGGVDYSQSVSATGLTRVSGDFTHFVVVVTSGVMELFVDGALEASHTADRASLFSSLGTYLPFDTRFQSGTTAAQHTALTAYYAVSTTGTTSSSSALESGIFSQALQASVTVDLGSALAPGTASWTASVWVYVADIGTNTWAILSKCCATNTDGVQVTATGTEVTVAFSDSAGALNATTVVGAVVPSADDWHHVCVVFDRDSAQHTASLYLDGQLEGSGVVDSGASIDSSSSLVLGEAANGAVAGTPFLDDFAIWQRVLTASDVVDVFSQGRDSIPLSELGANLDASDLGVGAKLWLGRNVLSTTYLPGTLGPVVLYDGRLTDAEVANNFAAGAFLDVAVQHQFTFDATLGDSQSSLTAVLSGAASLSTNWVALASTNALITLGTGLGTSISQHGSASFEMWVYLTAYPTATDATLFQAATASSTSAISITAGDAAGWQFEVVSARRGRTETTSASTPITLLNLVQLVAVVDADAHEHRLYLDGSKVASKTSALLTGVDVGTTWTHTLGSGMVGSVHDFRVYRGALTDADVLASFETDVRTPCPSFTPSNAAGNCTGYPFTTTLCTLECNTGYSLVGDGWSCSDDSTWDTSGAQCIVGYIQAQSLTFVDTNSSPRIIEGDLEIVPATASGGISSYNVHFGSDESTKLTTGSLFAAVPMREGESSLKFSVTSPYNLPLGATHFLVYAANSQGVEETQGYAIEIPDTKSEEPQITKQPSSPSVLHVAQYSTFQDAIEATVPAGALSFQWYFNGNALSATYPSATEPTIADTESDTVTLSGTWTTHANSSLAPYNGLSYLTLPPESDGSATFFPSVSIAGTYDVYVLFVPLHNRAASVGVRVGASGDWAFVDMRSRGSGEGGWQYVGRGWFGGGDGEQGEVVVARDGVGWVVADAVKLVHVDATSPSLMLSPVGTHNEGTYYCSVANGDNVVASNTFTLLVDEEPVVSSASVLPTTTRVARGGDSFSLSVVASVVSPALLVDEFDVANFDTLDLSSRLVAANTTASMAKSVCCDDEGTAFVGSAESTHATFFIVPYTEKVLPARWTGTISATVGVAADSTDAAVCAVLASPDGDSWTSLYSFNPSLQSDLTSSASWSTHTHTHTDALTTSAYVAVWCRAPNATQPASVGFRSLAITRDLTYQWYKNDVALEGEVSADLTIDRVLPQHDGAYTCKITNGVATFITPPCDLIVEEDAVQQDFLSLELNTATWAASYGSPATTQHATPFYFRDPEFVHLRGVVERNTAAAYSSVVGTLPELFRPIRKLERVCTTSPTAGDTTDLAVALYCSVDVDGTVATNQDADVLEPSTVSLDALSFTVPFTFADSTVPVWFGVEGDWVVTRTHDQPSRITPASTQGAWLAKTISNNPAALSAPLTKYVEYGEIVQLPSPPELVTEQDPLHVAHFVDGVSGSFWKIALPEESQVIGSATNWDGTGTLDIDLGTTFQITTIKFLNFAPEDSVSTYGTRRFRLQVARDTPSPEYVTMISDALISPLGMLAGELLEERRHMVVRGRYVRLVADSYYGTQPALNSLQVLGKETAAITVLWGSFGGVWNSNCTDVVDLTASLQESCNSLPTCAFTLEDTSTPSGCIPNTEVYYQCGAEQFIVNVTRDVRLDTIRTPHAFVLDCSVAMSEEAHFQSLPSSNKFTYTTSSFAPQVWTDTATGASHLRGTIVLGSSTDSEEVCGAGPCQVLRLPPWHVPSGFANTTLADYPASPYPRAAFPNFGNFLAVDSVGRLYVSHATDSTILPNADNHVFLDNFVLLPAALPHQDLSHQASQISLDLESGWVSVGVHGRASRNEAGVVCLGGVLHSTTMGLNPSHTAYEFLSFNGRVIAFLDTTYLPEFVTKQVVACQVADKASVCVVVIDPREQSVVVMDDSDDFAGEFNWVSLDGVCYDGFVNFVEVTLEENAVIEISGGARIEFG